jgi:hypothetical protein
MASLCERLAIVLLLMRSFAVVFFIQSGSLKPKNLEELFQV